MSNVALPNSFQHPNILIDKLAYFLTPEEEKVLNKAVREILGWQDKVETRRARIAISIFVEGKFKKDLPKVEENRLAYGCGLSENTVRQVLKSLHTFGILTRVGEANRDGQEYELQLNERAIDWAELQKRRDEKQNKNKYRTETARELNPLNNGVLSDSTPKQNGVQCDNTPLVLSDSRGGGYCQVRVKKPSLKPTFKPRNYLTVIAAKRRKRSRFLKSGITSIKRLWGISFLNSPT